MAIVRMVPSNSTVLDDGCGAGQLGRYLWDHKGCSITGVDIDNEAIEAAMSEVYDWGEVADLNKVNLSAIFAEDSFDVVILADVLEHVIDPIWLLKESKDLINNDGYIIISVPNIAWLPIRLSMAMGHFDYQDYGPLDRTHLRFFTHSSIKKLIDDAGLSIIDEDVSVKPSNILIHRLARLLPGSMAYQMVFKCQIKEPMI